MTDSNTDPNKIDELLSRGVEEIIGIDNLKERLLKGEKLRIKLGIDPTSPHIHLGRAIALLKLRDFQELGHTIVFIVGDFTGVIGDTSDKESERPMVSSQDIETNKQSYFDQIAKIVDVNKAEMHYNAEWLSSLTYKEIGEHADLFSVSDFIARDNIRRRLDAGKRVSLRETLYPLMQGYDSVAVQADVEIGGTDQRFNMLSGRTLQEHFNQAPQAIVMGPLIEGLDGRKMSSSWGNTINLTDEPSDMYGKVMSMHDELVPKYFEVCTRLPISEVQELQEAIQSESLHPRDAKMRLAKEIVTLCHGNEAADKAQEAFVHVFQNKELPEEIPQYPLPESKTLIDFATAAFAISKSELRRLLTQNGVKVNDETETDENKPLSSGDIVKLGKKRWAQVVN